MRGVTEEEEGALFFVAKTGVFGCCGMREMHTGGTSQDMSSTTSGADWR